MPVVIRRYGPEDCAAVAEFNRRLAAGGVSAEMAFPETHQCPWLPDLPGRPTCNRYFLAWDGDAVRGGYVARSQDFRIAGETRPVAFYYHPISEGIIDRRWTAVGVQMLRHFTAAHPLAFALGMGGFDQPLPRMLSAMKWQAFAVPFRFRVNHPGAFFRNIQALRTTPARRACADLLAVSGAGYAGLKLAQGLRSLRPCDRSITCEAVPCFGEWADRVWEECRGCYSMVGCRDARNLNAFYASGFSGVTRLKINRGGAAAGWAVVGDVAMSGNRHFGNLRVGSLLDALAHPRDAGAVVAAATRFLAGRGVDLLVSNQAHSAWTDALERNGYFKGPSNFIFSCSPGLARLLEPFTAHQALVHVNRGDGEGPTHLA